MEALIDHEFYMTSCRGTKSEKILNTRAGAPPLKIRIVEEINVSLEEQEKEEPLFCRKNLSIATFQKESNTCCIESENEQTLKEFLQGVKKKKSKKLLACVVRTPPVEDFFRKVLVPAKKRKRKRLRSTGELYSHAKLLDLTQEKDETLDEWLKRTSGSSRKSDSKDENKDIKVFERRKVRVNPLGVQKVKVEALEGKGIGASMSMHGTQSSTKLQDSSDDNSSVVINLEENEPQIFDQKGSRTSSLLSSPSIPDVQEAVKELKSLILETDCAQQAALRGEGVIQDMSTKPEVATLLQFSEVECCENSSHTLLTELGGAHKQSLGTSAEVADASEDNVHIPTLLEGVDIEMKQGEWGQSNISKNLSDQFLAPIEDVLEDEGECEIQQPTCGTGNELLGVSITSEVMEVHLEDLALRSKLSDPHVIATVPLDMPFLHKCGDEQPKGAFGTQMDAGTEMELDAHTQLETVIVADFSDAPIMCPVATETMSKGVENQLGVLESDSSATKPSEIPGLAAIINALDVSSSAKLTNDNLNCSPKQKIRRKSRLKCALVSVSSHNDMKSDKESNDGEGDKCYPCSEYDGEPESLLIGMNSKNSGVEISPCVEIVEEGLTILEDKELNISTRLSECVTSVTSNSNVSRTFVEEYSSEDCKLGATYLPNLKPRYTVSDAEAPGQGHSASKLLGGRPAPQRCDERTTSLSRKARKKIKAKKKIAASLDASSQKGSIDIHLKVNEDCPSNPFEGLSLEKLPVLLEEGLGLEAGHALDDSHEISDKNGGSNNCLAELPSNIALDVNKWNTTSSEGRRMCQERDIHIDNSIIEGQTSKKTETNYSCTASCETSRGGFEAEDILASEEMVMDLSQEIGSLVKSFTSTDIAFSECAPEATQGNGPTGEGAQDEECWNEVATCSSPAEINEGFQGVHGGVHPTTEFQGSSGMKAAAEIGQCPDSPLPGPSKMPCKRKAISPRSQQELLRASRPQSGRIPFRIKLLKSFSQHESVDRRNKESSQNFVLGNDDLNFSFGDSIAFSERQDDREHTKHDGLQSASLSPMSPPLQLTQNDPSSLTTSCAEDPLETIGCSIEHIGVGSPKHNNQPTSHSTDIQHVLLQATEESNVKLNSFQESPIRMSIFSQLPNSSGSPHTLAKTLDSSQQIRSILKTSSLKRDLQVVPCQGSCKCPKCITSYEHSKTAMEFIASQMTFADRIAGRLISEMTNMRNVMDEEHKSGGEGEQSASSSTLKKVALERAVKAQEWARKELLKMSRDSKRVCRLIDTGPRRIIYADEAGRRLCHVKFLPGKESQEDSQLLP